MDFTELQHQRRLEKPQGPKHQQVFRYYLALLAAAVIMALVLPR